jgi:hypothetical protein
MDCGCLVPPLILSVFIFDPNAPYNRGFGYQLRGGQAVSQSSGPPGDRQG